MGIIFDTITELAKLNKKYDGPKPIAMEVAGVYYVYTFRNGKLSWTEHKSLQEVEGSEEWTSTKINVVGLSDDPKYQSMTMYFEHLDTVTANSAAKKVCSHVMKTTSGNIVHLAN